MGPVVRRGWRRWVRASCAEWTCRPGRRGHGSRRRPPVPQLQTPVRRPGWSRERSSVEPCCSCDTGGTPASLHTHTRYDTIKVNKFSHTRYRALGPELIPVYRQSARRWREVNHAIDLAVGCHYFLPGLRLPMLRTPDGATCKRQHTSDSSLLVIYRPRKDERLSWTSWLTCSGRFTHISGHPSAAGRAQDRESSPVIDRRSITVPHHQPTIRYETIF